MFVLERTIWLTIVWSYFPCHYRRKEGQEPDQTNYCSFAEKDIRNGVTINTEYIHIGTLFAELTKTVPSLHKSKLFPLLSLFIAERYLCMCKEGTVFCQFSKEGTDMDKHRDKEHYGERHHTNLSDNGKPPSIINGSWWLGFFLRFSLSICSPKVKTHMVVLFHLQYSVW